MITPVNMLKTSLLAAGLCLCLCSTGGAECPKVVTGFSLLDLQGKKASISCADHKVLIINFWATWCGPCRIEIPQLNDLHRDYHAQGVKVIGISLDSMRPEWLQPYVKALKIAYPVYLGKAEELQSKLSIVGIPATLVIDAKGAIRRQLVGYHSKDVILKVIREILDAEQKKS